MKYVCIAVGINVISYSVISLEQGSITAFVAPQPTVHFPEINSNSFGIITSSLYIVGFIPFIVGFVSAWIGTALLLSRYSKIIGRLKYWTILL